VVDLAARLGVTHVTVNRTIARLQQAGLVAPSLPGDLPYGSWSGARWQCGPGTDRRGVPPILRNPGQVAEMDAEGIEHHVSPETLAAFNAALA
jgi:DtxR family manganese transport transcriptional regulator